ncbi:hypothetical protein E2C01_081784 [Portunus trituberculatus]|uniref:Uncharacterized protein n=1 Tax=Portunus trituberculatus TaxID=210409 RepID=A0A5B7INA4_PORTR|nr:hypothetical protein [Portunus trituberculatus]
MGVRGCARPVRADGPSAMPYAGQIEAPLAMPSLLPPTAPDRRPPGTLPTPVHCSGHLSGDASTAECPIGTSPDIYYRQRRGTVRVLSGSHQGSPAAAPRLRH